MFKAGVIDRETYVAWLAPFLLAAVLAGIWSVQQEAGSGEPAAFSARLVAVDDDDLPAPDGSYPISQAFFLEPAEAVAWFREKGVVSYEEFQALDAAAKARAFSVAKLSDDYSMQVVDDSIAEALATGQTKNGWLTQLEETFAKAGLTLEGGSSYWGLVFDQNATLALQGGRYVQMMRVAEARPYWLYWNPSPVTELCQAMAGRVFRYDDPAIQKLFPPNHFKCKSQFITLDDDELRASGIREISTGGGLPPVPEGFAYDPADAFFRNAGVPGLAPTPEGAAAAETFGV